MAKRRPPSRTVEGRENQLIALALDLAEKQLLDGSASPSVITQILKLGSTRTRLEKEKLIEENKLLKARTKAIESGEELARLYEDAMASMKMYDYRRDDDEDLY